MIEIKESLQKVSIIIREHILRGFVPDTDTLNFIKSSYGLNDPEEIISFLEGGDDDGAVIDMISYPSDRFRESIEELIPAEGFSSDEIQSVYNTINILCNQTFILFNNRKIPLSENDSHFCYEKFIQRLNLSIPFNYIEYEKILSGSINIFAARALLRKKKFIPGEENSLFINDLINNYYHLKNNSVNELIYLIDISSDLLNSPEEKPFDIFSRNKDFYENSIMESEEFSRLLKTYSMEFIMMKRIQPPLLSIDEARSMINAIDRLTSIVYGMVIPSVRNVLIDY